MARDVLQTVALIDDDDYICASQSPAAGAILINGIGATNTNAMGQRITLTSGGNDSGITFTITGTCPDGRAQTETITGGNIAAVTTTKYFSSWSAIVQSGAVAGTLKVGVLQANGAVTKTLPANFRSPNFALGLGLTVNGTITCTVQHSMGDKSLPQGSNTWFNHFEIASVTANKDGNYAFGVTMIRMLVVPTSTATAKLEVVGA